MDSRLGVVLFSLVVNLGCAPLAKPASVAEVRGRAAAMAACEGGEAQGCRRLAEAMLDGAGPEQAKRALPALQAGCRAKNADACGGAALAGQIIGGPGFDQAASLKALEAACAAGSSMACSASNEAQVRNTKDAEALASLAKSAVQSCTALGGSICFTAATYAAGGIGGPSDAPRAEALLGRACDTGSGWACYTKALSLAGAGADGARRSRALYERACADDVAEACFNLGYQQLFGEGGGKDAVNGKRLAVRGCELGDGKACDYLAATNGAAVDPEHRSTAYPNDEAFQAGHRAWCELGGIDACVDLAFSVGNAAEHSGELERMEEVLSRLQLGCHRGSMRGCNVLGHVVRDAQTQCEAGNAGQCLVSGYAWTMGVSMPRVNGASFPADPVKARDAFQRACDGKRQSACARLSAAR